MRLLIAGGAGYIGSATARLLTKAGHYVTVYDSLVKGHREAVAGIPLVVGDIMDAARLTYAMRDCGAEGVLHFAALIEVGESVSIPEKYYRNNVAGALNILSAMRQAGAKCLVFSSTAATYGPPVKVPMPETHPQQPINPYGRTKLAIEWAMQDYAQAYGLRCAALRYFNACGAEPDGKHGEMHLPESHLIPRVLLSLLGRLPELEVYGTDYPTPDGTCVRDYIYLLDLAEAHRLAIEALAHDKDGTFRACNLGTGKGYSVREILDATERVTGKKVPVRFGPRRPGDSPELVADSSLAQRELNWKPARSDLDNIIGTAWKWHSGGEYRRR